VRLVETRLLDGPNIYRLEPTVKLEVTVGRRRTWYGQRSPGRHAVVRLGARVPATKAPRPVAEMADWVRRLHRLALGRRVPVAIHRTSEPGHWVVAFPWSEADRAETLARAAFRLTEGRTEGTLRRALRRIADADGRAPEWITDDDRRMPIVSISGTNGKSTTTRMIAHLMRSAGRTVGTTTSDGVIIDGAMVEEGDLTGPMGAHRVLTDPSVEVAVLETARGGIVLRGVGYQSNEAAVLTNVSSDHLDLHGLHTLPELAEVKSVIARITRASGTVVLNADDPLVAAVSRQVKAKVSFFSLQPSNRRVQRHLDRGGRALVLDDGWLVEVRGKRRARRRIVSVAEVPATLRGVARHNVANALAAAGAGLALGLTPAAVAEGLRTFHATAEFMPGRLNLHRQGRRLVIVDFAHNEAGVSALLDMAEAILGGPHGRRAGTISAIVGTAGDRPDDTLRGIGRIAAERADEVAIKETLRYLRGRSRQSAIGEFQAGMRQGGLAAAVSIPVYEDEPLAVRGELTTAGRLAASDDGTPRLLLAMCHADRPAVERELAALGFAPLTDPAELEQLRPDLP
jgi:cyanophycin synthetase